jgi:signal transduction histidine kinase
MSHELRSPLVAIRGMIAAVSDDSAASEQARAVANDVNREAGELLELINNILDAAKLEARQVSLLFEPVDVAAVLERCILRGRALARGKEVTLVEELAPALPPVQGDFVKLQQIFTNLIANAVKFTERGRVTVRTHASHDGVLVEIADTGVGMTPDQQQRIWHPFQQGDGGIARKHGGTGLGLAIVKGLVDLHRGSIAVESKAGVGTTFRVTLPRGQTAASAA